MGGLCCIKKRRGGSVERVDVLAGKNAKDAKMIAVLRWRCFNAEAQGRKDLNHEIH